MRPVTVFTGEHLVLFVCRNCVSELHGAVSYVSDAGTCAVCDATVATWGALVHLEVKPWQFEKPM